MSMFKCVSEVPNKTWIFIVIGFVVVLNLNNFLL